MRLANGSSPILPEARGASWSEWRPTSATGALTWHIEPTAYYPYSQVPESVRSLVEANMGIAVRSSVAQSELLHSINAAVAAVNQSVPVYDVKTMDSMLSDSGSLRNFDLFLLGAFSFWRCLWPR